MALICRQVRWWCCRRQRGQGCAGMASDPALPCPREDGRQEKAFRSSRPAHGLPALHLPCGAQQRRGAHAARRARCAANLRRQAQLARHVCLGAPPQQAPEGRLQQRQQAGAPCVPRYVATAVKASRGCPSNPMPHRALAVGRCAGHEPGTRAWAERTVNKPPPPKHATPFPLAPTSPAALLVWPLQHALPPVAVGVGGCLQEGQQAVQVLQPAGEGGARHAPAGPASGQHGWGWGQKTHGRALPD